MIKDNLRLCIVKIGSLLDYPYYQSTMAGFYQWAKCFSGDICNATDFLTSDKYKNYDLILIRLTEKNYPLIHAVRNILGDKNKSKLLLACDTPLFMWNDTYTDLKKLQEAAGKADLLFGTEYSISYQLSNLTGRRVYEIPYPADIEKIQRHQSVTKEDIMTVLYCSNLKGLVQSRLLSRLLDLKPVFIHSSRPLKDWQKTEDTVIYAEDEDFFCQTLAKSKLTIVPSDLKNYGKLIIYAASLGNLVIGDGHTDAQRRCYPYTSPAPCQLRDYMNLYFWTKVDEKAAKFLIDTAQAKVQYYNRENLKNRLLHILSFETQEKEFSPHFLLQTNLHTKINYERDIRRIHGPKKITCHADDFVVVSLVKNGTPHLEAFMRHYQKLNARHFFIADNNSDDHTSLLLRQFDNVTLYHTKLPHKLFECEIRRNLIERHCRGLWCLYVDIDELFDFPYSDRIGMKGLIHYLAGNHYTAMVAYLLDMFSDNELSGSHDNHEDINLESRYSYYDISHIRKADYFSFNKTLCNYNILDSKDIKYYYGGIRDKYFSGGTNRFVLTKHPLMFIDNFIEPLTNPHYCNKARVADISGVLRHYKFIPSFKEKVKRSMTRDSDYDHFTKMEYKMYEKFLDEEKHPEFFSSNAKKLRHVNELIKSHFVHVSKKFKDFVKAWNLEP